MYLFDIQVLMAGDDSISISSASMRKVQIGVRVYNGGENYSIYNEWRLNLNSCLMPCIHFFYIVLNRCRPYLINEYLFHSRV